MTDVFHRPNSALPGEIKQIHVNLSGADHKLLLKLTHTMKKSASDVVRELVRQAAKAGKVT
jgi:hypothetical protein